MRVAVFGGTGTVGTHVIEGLTNNGIATTALVRAPGKASALRDRGTDVVLGDLEQLNTVAATIEGADAVFLLTANSPSQGLQERDLIDLVASTSGVPIVKLSVVGADLESPLHLARIHAASEAHLRASGVGFVVVQPGWFMQNLSLAAKGIAHDGALRFPIGDGGIAAVDARDVADACVVVLTDLQRHLGSTLSVTGAHDVTGASMAATLTTVLGRSIEFVDSDRAHFEPLLVSQGYGAEVVEDLVMLYDLIMRHGFLAGPTTSVHEITGRPARSFEAFVRDHASWFVPTT